MNTETFETVSLNLQPSDATQDFSATDISAFLSVLQRLYVTIAEEMGYPAQFLYVTQIKHPNSEITLKGLAEPIRAIKELLQAFPDLIAKLWNIRGVTRAQKQKLDADIAEDQKRQVEASIAVERVLRESEGLELEQRVRQARSEAEMAREQLEMLKSKRELLNYLFEYNEAMFDAVGGAVAGMKGWPSGNRGVLVSEGIRYRMANELGVAGRPLVVSVR
jgi:hypothetical protein